MRESRKAVMWSRALTCAWYHVQKVSHLWKCYCLQLKPYYKTIPSELTSFQTLPLSTLWLVIMPWSMHFPCCRLISCLHQVTALWGFGMPIQEHFYVLSRIITAEGMSPSPISSDSRYRFYQSYVLFSAALHPLIWISPSFFRAPQTNIWGSSTLNRCLGGPCPWNLTHKR